MLNLIRDPFTALALIVAVGIAIFAYWRYRRLKESLSRLKSELHFGAATLDKIKDREGFAHDFQNVDLLLRGTETLGAAWREFAATLIVSPRGVLSTRRSSAFFGTDLPYHSSVNLRAFDAVPNQLIGIGLLFTFIFLALTLIFARLGLEATDPAEARNALVNLLGAASTKFVTSIVAIGASLVFVYRKNALLKDVDLATENFCAEVERLTVPTRAEEVMEAAYGELQRHGELLERSDDALASAIAEQLDRTLRENLGSAILPVADAINDMARDIAAINESTLLHMVEKFSKDIGLAAREHSAEMGRMLNEASRAMAGVPDRIDTASERFTKVLDSVSSQLETSLAASASSLAELLASAEAGIGDTGKAFDSVAARLEAALGKLEEAESNMLSQAVRHGESSKAAATELAGAAAGLKEASEAVRPLAEAGERIEAWTIGLRQAAEVVSELVASGERSAAQAGAVAGTLVEQAQAFRAGIEGLEASLTTVFRELASGIESFQATASGAVKGVDQGLATAVDRLSDVVHRIGAAAPAVAARKPAKAPPAKRDAAE